MDTNKSKLINRHYQEVYECNKCFNMPGCKLKFDPSRVSRKVCVSSLNTEIFIIGQALASSTQRLSGLPYTFPDGRLSNTGKKLDSYLSKIGYAMVADSRRKPVYSSDIVNCYPGRKISDVGDNKPTRVESDNCHYWLTEEIKIVRPKVLLLLGKIATETFLELYCKKQLDVFESSFYKEYKIQIEDMNLSLFCVPHPASYYRKLGDIYKMTLDLIKTVIENAKVPDPK
jgi:uracil-DNA glycosylase family 4